MSRTQRTQYYIYGAISIIAKEMIEKKALVIILGKY
jgi:hypothetical protein